MLQMVKYPSKKIRFGVERSPPLLTVYQPFKDDTRLVSVLAVTVVFKGVFQCTNLQQAVRIRTCQIFDRQIERVFMSMGIMCPGGTFLFQIS